MLSLRKSMLYRLSLLITKSNNFTCWRFWNRKIRLHFDFYAGKYCRAWRKNKQIHWFLFKNNLFMVNFFGYIFFVYINHVRWFVHPLRKEEYTILLFFETGTFGTRKILANTSTLIFRWKWKLSRRIFFDFLSTLAKQRQNYVDSTSINQRCFNVEIWLKMKVETMNVYGRCFNVDKTTLKQHWENYVNSTSMNQLCFNVDVYRGCFDVQKTALKQLCQYMLCWCSLENGSIVKQSFEI